MHSIRSFTDGWLQKQKQFHILLWWLPVLLLIRIRGITTASYSSQNKNNENQSLECLVKKICTKLVNQGRQQWFGIFYVVTWKFSFRLFPAICKWSLPEAQPRFLLIVRPLPLALWSKSWAYSGTSTEF